MKRLLAGSITIALMAGLVWSGIRNPKGLEPVGTSWDLASEAAGPEDRVRSLLSFGATGDLDGYLDCFAPGLQARLAHEAEEKGPAAFAEALRSAARARQGHAVFAPELDGLDRATVVVESVYPDRNERQTYRLERLSGNWRIAGSETVQGKRPPGRFGTPASFQNPEGVPVPTDDSTGEAEPPRE